MTDRKQDALNRATWAKSSSRKWLDQYEGFVDEGERVVLEHVRDRVRGTPILDLGVGTGRTIPMLRPLASEYLAIDYLASMVEASRRSHPEARVEEGDARDLEGVASDHYGLVNFSFAGIDAVSAADRKLVVRQVHRVLRPGGLFVFSTLNMDGPSYRQRPWRLRVWPARNPIRVAARWGRALASIPIDAVNWLRVRSSIERGAGWAVAPLSAHHYRVLAHYTTLARQLEELRSEGFTEPPAIFTSDAGERCEPKANKTDIDAFYFVVARPA